VATPFDVKAYQAVSQPIPQRSIAMFDTIIEAEAHYLIQDRTQRPRRHHTIDVRRRRMGVRRPSWL
jgi:hypothetical protein